jgi:hypothetical protein
LRTWFDDPNRRVFVVGEVAQAHDGSLGTAHAYIDAIADAGADAVKFQTHIAAAESTAAEPWRVRFSPQDATRYDYWKRMEFTPEQWAGLSDHAKARKLTFLSTPFSFEAVDLLERLDIAAWKVGSGELTNAPSSFISLPRPAVRSSSRAAWPPGPTSDGAVSSRNSTVFSPSWAVHDGSPAPPSGRPQPARPLRPLPLPGLSPTTAAPPPPGSPPSRSVPSSSRSTSPSPVRRSART